MNYPLLGPRKLEVELRDVLDQLAAGKAPSEIESRRVEIKEEPGRRSRDSPGLVLPGQSENEEAAVYLANELACMSNTPGSGVIILGVANDGTIIGTALDAEWLRHRIYELTNSRLTVNVRQTVLSGQRLLLLEPPESIEAVRSPRNQRIYWRVADNCVEVDAATWAEGRVLRAGFDWSDQPSGHTINEANPVAIEVARSYLKAAGEDSHSAELASATSEDMLRRLNLVKPDGYLSNAGSLLFVQTPEPGIDYIRRDYTGADSSARVNRSGPLLVQFEAAMATALAVNRTIHVSIGPVQAQVRAIPELALREAIINGLIHRDWISPQPTVVEHVGDTLVVTSPGGFVPGVTPGNIITYPSTPRYRALASAVTALRLAEREGIGVDRMVREMLAIGHTLPEIIEIEGPRVRVVLVGGVPDKIWMDFLRTFDSEDVAREVDVLLLLDLLVATGWFDAASAAPVLQKSLAETHGAIGRLEQVKAAGEPVILRIDGVPDAEPPAWRLSDASREKLNDRLEPLRGLSNRSELILRWARHRGRVSSTEVADLFGLSASHSNTVLTSLAEEGTLKPNRSTRQGRGFFYLPVD